jgi:hypothetical protein
MSKTTIEQITISDIIPDVQKLTRNLHIYDSTLTNLHKIFFDYLKIDELECISGRVLSISNLNGLNAFQYYSDPVKTTLDTDLFRIKCYMEAICESVTKEGIKLLHELQAEELARTASN